MIRRGFWVVVGATLGVSGYRRASRLARSVFPARPGGALVTSPGQLRPPVITGRSLLAAAASAGRGTAQGAAFARDVAEGMAEYLDRQGDEAGRTLGSQRGGPRAGFQPASPQHVRAARDGRRRGDAP
jgi:hypothetical protein